MGNPASHFPLGIGALTKPSPFEVKHCLLCQRCEALSADDVVACSWHGEWHFPEKGCRRFVLDLSGLGEEGLEDLTPAQ
jgi:hypothetical protein